MSSNNSKILFGGHQLEPFLFKEKSSGELIIKKLRNLGDAIILINGSTGEQFTASELLKKSIQVAFTLKKYDINHGKKVSIILENSFEFFVVFCGTIICGGIIIPFNPAYSELELQHLIGLSQPTIIFTTEKYCEKIKKVTKNCTFIDKIILINGSQLNIIENGNELSSLDFLIQEFNILPEASFTCHPVNIETDTVIIMTSSGTTGLPKGVEHPHMTLFKYDRRFRGEYNENIRLGYNTIRLMPVSFAHSFGCFFTFSLLLNNFTVVFLSQYKPADFLKAIETFRINTAYAVTPIMILLCKSPLVNQYNLTSLKQLICATMALSKEVTKAVQKRFENIKIRQSYGMTEIMGLISQSDTHCTLGSIGHLRPGVWGKVVDLENGQLLGPNQHGEICFKGGMVMKGYLNNPAATKQILDEHGWWHTGDIGYYDKNEEWFYVDRFKDLIKYKGHQIAPAELEGIILEYPKVLDVGVVGIPNQEADEIPMAFIVLKKYAMATSKEICDFVAERVAPFKRLSGGVQFVNEIPKNNNGKIVRRDLRKMLESIKSKI